MLCKGTSLKWTEWEGEMAGNFMLLLYRRNSNTRAQEGSAVTILFYDQVVFGDIHTNYETKVSVVGQYNSCWLN